MYYMIYMKKIVLITIKLYQKVFSLDHGIFSYFFNTRICRFHPSCSEYTYEAVEKFGILKGIYLGSKRVLRCHPWNDGGYDPVPKK